MVLKGGEFKARLRKGPRRAEVGVRCEHPWAMEEGAARVLGPDVPLQQEGKETPSELGTREREGTTGSSCFFKNLFVCLFGARDQTLKIPSLQGKHFCR